MGRAIGMLETYGLLPAIEGLDAALKSANVTVCSFDYVSGGLIAWVVEGDVGSVRVAVSAGKAAASRVGEVVSENVIARLAVDVEKILPEPARPGGRKKSTGIHRREFSAKAEPSSEAEQKKPPAPVQKKVAEAKSKAEPKSEAEPEKQVQASAGKDKGAKISNDKLDAMTVIALRTLARKTEGITLSRVEIRDAKKDTLVKAIKKAQNKARE